MQGSQFAGAHFQPDVASGATLWRPNSSCSRSLTQATIDDWLADTKIDFGAFEGLKPPLQWCFGSQTLLPELEQRN